MQFFKLTQTYLVHKIWFSLWQFCCNGLEVRKLQDLLLSSIEIEKCIYDLALALHHFLTFVTKNVPLLSGLPCVQFALNILTYIL